VPEHPHPVGRRENARLSWICLLGAGASCLLLNAVSGAVKRLLGLRSRPRSGSPHPTPPDKPIAEFSTSTGRNTTPRFKPGNPKLRNNGTRHGSEVRGSVREDVGPVSKFEPDPGGQEVEACLVHAGEGCFMQALLKFAEQRDEVGDVSAGVGELGGR
jgi:hypothetical protein